jgi:hypothetical protein
MLFLKKMFTEVITPTSDTEGHANLSWNLPSISTVSAVDGTHQRGVDMVTSLVRISAKSDSTAKISKNLLPQTLLRQQWNVTSY